jgi:hypothetical protein
VVCLDPVVGVLLKMVERLGQELVEHRRVGGGSVGGDLDRTGGVNHRSLEEPPAAWPSRRSDSITSMIWPNWSTARYK